MQTLFSRLDQYHESHKRFLVLYRSDRQSFGSSLARAQAFGQILQMGVLLDAWSRVYVYSGTGVGVQSVLLLLGVLTTLLLFAGLLLESAA